jgi:hypothetical protein
MIRPVNKLEQLSALLEYTSARLALKEQLRLLAGSGSSAAND